MIKYLEIYEKLKTDIDNGTYKYLSTIPTENNLCKQFNVSRIVIRMAVDKLAKQGYVEKKAGFGTKVILDVREKPTNKVIGIIFSFLASSFGAAILLSIESEARKYGYHIIFKNSNKDPKCENECLNELLEFGVAGIIMLPIHNETVCPGLNPFIDRGIPIVLIDRDLQKMNLSFVGTDSILETKSSVGRLFSFGFKRMGLVSQDITGTTSLSERVKGFQLAHEKANMPFKASQILSNISSVSFYTTSNYSSDKQNIKEFLQKNNFDCVLATELGVSQIISDVISENESLKNIALATFDRGETALKFGKYYILQNQTEMGKKAVSMLYRQIKDGCTCVKQFLSAEFVSL